jgi:hypothetical protein
VRSPPLKGSGEHIGGYPPERLRKREQGVVSRGLISALDAHEGDPPQPGCDGERFLSQACCLAKCSDALP